MCSSIFLVMGTAVERYLAVCRPHHYRTVSEHYSTVTSIIELQVITIELEDDQKRM